jgi:type II secretory pathway pseudopilin PulG
MSGMNRDNRWDRAIGANAGARALRRTVPGAVTAGASRARTAGMSLAELLIAMMILLVGIYAVAAVFPSLFGQVQADSDRTAMARLTQRTLSLAAADLDRLPEAIFGYDDTIAASPYTAIPPDEEPRDPDPESASDYTANPPNSRDDIIHVIGERLTVPAPHTGVGGTTRDLTVAVPLMMGMAGLDPATGAAAVSVYQLVPLVRTETAPATPTTNTPVGTFYIDRTTGTVCLPTQAAGIPQVPLTAPTAVVDYAWTDLIDTTATKWRSTYYVQGERVAHGTPVAAKNGLPVAPGAPECAGVIPEECRAWLVVPFTFGDTGNLGFVANNSPAPAPGSFLLEYNYGATLLFNPADQGRQLCVDYALRTGTTGNPIDDRRRELIVYEDQQVPSASQGGAYAVQLAVNGLSDEDPLLEGNLAGTGNPVNVLAIDLTDGQGYDDVSHTLSVDMGKGIVTFPDTAACLGHTCRFYYRTLDQHCIQVTKAPATFVDKVVADRWSDRSTVAYKTYQVQAPAAAGQRTVLTFPESSAGQTVSVDYTYGAPPALPLRKTGELHVINEGAYQIALDNPDVVSIVAVRGVSVKVRGWWRAQKGKLRHVDVDSCLVPGYMAQTVR